MTKAKKGIAIKYEDKNILVVQKPAGLAIQGGEKVQKSLLSELHPSGRQAHIVHRLDKDVGGLVLLAKDSSTASFLGRMMPHIQKTYQLIVLGRLPSNRVECNVPLRKEPGGKPLHATTHFEATKHFSNYSLMKARLLTGRKHQIRRHASAIGHPIVGDRLYGDFSLNRQLQKTYPGKLPLFLFSQRLRLPFYNGGMEWSLPLPESFNSFANAHGLQLSAMA